MEHCCGDENGVQYVQLLPPCFKFIFSAPTFFLRTYFLNFFLQNWKYYLIFYFNFFGQHFMERLRSIKTFQRGMWLRWRPWHGVRLASTSVYNVCFYTGWLFFLSKIDSFCSFASLSLTPVFSSSLFLLLPQYFSTVASIEHCAVVNGNP